MRNIVNNISYQFKKHRPTLLMISGTILGAAAIGFTVKSSLKVEEIIAEDKEKLNLIEANDPKNNPEMAERYSEEDVRNDKIQVYTSIGIKIAKLYLPTIICALLSEASFIASNKILMSRCGAMTIAFAALTNQYQSYRKRVVEAYGEKVDEDFHLGVQQMKIEENIIDEEGKTKKYKKTIDVIDTNDISSPYAKFFDQFSIFFHKDETMNYYFLKEQREWAQMNLNTRGYLFLNEVYKSLGIPLTKEGYSVGWVKKGKGTKIIEFKMRNVKSIDDLRDGILIDFNVDGPIIDLLPIEKY